MRQKIVEYVKHYFRLYSVQLLFLFSLIFIGGSLWTFKAHDQSFLYHARHGSSENMFGYFGASLAAIFIYLFGSSVYMFLGVLLYSSLFVFRVKDFKQESDRFAGILLFACMSSVLCNLYQVGFYEYSTFGGVLGKYWVMLLSFFDMQAKLFIAYSLLFVSSILIVRFFHLPVARVIATTSQAIFNYCVQLDNFPARFIRLLAGGIAQCCYLIHSLLSKVVNRLNGSFLNNPETSIVEFERDESVDKQVDTVMQDLFAQEYDFKSVDYKQKQVDLFDFDINFDQTEIVEAPDDMSAIEEVVDSQPLVQKSYDLPDVDMMLSKGNHGQNSQVTANQAVLDEQSAILEEKLALFGIKGQVVRVHPGPVITMFEYRPENHIKLSKIMGLEDDLAMALQAVNIRILAPIPGKSVVGFEVANKDRSPVLLSEIFHGSSWLNFNGSLPLILGENTQGSHIVVDLASMPHVLIAGSTGSGKSVALNCMLISLLCAKKPEDMKLIIIDPKQLEFSAYDDIAHLLFPIVTDAKKAVPVLKWLVSEMESRYELMSAHGVKNIFEYQKLAEQNIDLENMPFIVLIIDELADLMMTTGKEIEDLIARIAQMSRAAGIHMIVATQRPSVDVITGLIKVNFPNRISFKVTSKVDSRTILDAMGAERLLGKGDMLFIDAKDPEIQRVHGAYVSNQEIEFLVNHIKAQQDVEYLDISQFMATDKNNALYDADQDLYKEVVDMIKDFDEISISMIQRHFRIGYNRSARIIQTLEADGLIMPNDGGKMRRVVKD